MDTLKLSKKEIQLDKEDLAILDTLQKDLRENENYVLKERTAIKEIETVIQQTSYYIQTAENFSERLRKRKEVNSDMLRQVYKLILNADNQIGNLINEYAMAIYKVKVENNKIMKELTRLRKNLRTNSKDIYNFLSKEPTSHYIQ